MAAASLMLREGKSAFTSVEPRTALLLWLLMGGATSSSSARSSSVERTSDWPVLAMATASKMRERMSPDLTVGPLVAPTRGRVWGSPLGRVGLCTLGCTLRLGMAQAFPERLATTHC